MQGISSLLSALRWVGHPWVGGYRRFLGALQACVSRKERPLLPFLDFSLTVLVGWHLYVPLHELLHVAGCVLSGGTVQELRLHPLFGGAILRRVFPFIRSGTDAAGRLVRFETGGSDLVYFITDFFPFVLTALAALPFLRKAQEKRSVVWLAAGSILLVALPVSVPGDLYEMGAILVGGTLVALNFVSPSAEVSALRSDDLFLLLSQFGRRFPEHPLGWGLAIGTSLLVGTLIGSLVLAASAWVADRFPLRGR